MLEELMRGGAEKLAQPPSPLAGALTAASLGFGRLAHAVDAHPLRGAILFRARLDAVRRMAAADGQMIDPWHLAAVLEGLRLRMDSELRNIDRGMIFEAARHALGLHRWLVEPDFDQEGEIQRAEAVFARASERGGLLLSAGYAFHSLIDGGEGRAPARAAMVRHWDRSGIFTLPLPLTGAAALGPEVPWEQEDWLVAWLNALAAEAADVLDLVRALERSWRAARISVAGRRRNSHASAAVDFLAASPLVSATSLGAALDIAVKNASRLLDELRRDGLVIEVTHRAKRRLFALANLAPLRACVAGPRRPQAGRLPGRPRQERFYEVEPVPPSPPAGPRVAHPVIDYADLDMAIAQLDETVRKTRSSLQRIGLPPKHDA